MLNIIQIFKPYNRKTQPGRCPKYTVGLGLLTIKISIFFREIVRNFSQSSLTCRYRLSVIAGVVIFLCLLAPLQAADWPKFHRDNQNSGYSSENIQLPLSLDWIYQDPNNGRSIRGVAVFDGIVYFGAEDVYAVSLSEGDRLWFDTPDVTFSTPAVEGDYLYIGTYSEGFNCYDRLNGTLIWNHPTGDAVDTSPLVYSNWVYFGCSDNKVYCLNKSNGSEYWSYTSGGDVLSSPCQAEGKIFIGSDDEYLYAFDADPSDQVDEGISDPPGSTYDLIWKTQLVDYVESSPAYCNGMVYVGSGHEIYGIDAEDGSVIWQYHTHYSITKSSPAIDDSVLYIGDGAGAGDPGYVYAVDVSDFSLVWEKQLGHWVDSSPIVNKDYVFVGCSDHKIYGLNRSNGNIVWPFLTGGMIEGSAAISDGHLLVGSNDYLMYCFQFESADEDPPYTSFITPSPGAVGVSPDTDISFRLLDEQSGVDLSTFSLAVNSQTMNINSPGIDYSGNLLEYHITYDPAQSFSPGSNVYVEIDVSDFSGNAMNTVSYSFTIEEGADIEPPYVTDLDPAPGELASIYTDITFHLKDDQSGVDLQSFLLNVEGDNFDIYSEEIQYEGDLADYSFVYTPQQPFDLGSTVEVEIDAADNAGIVMNTYSYSFETYGPDYEPPYVSNPIPTPNQTGVSALTDISFDIFDTISASVFILFSVVVS